MNWDNNGGNLCF
jgi:hypothetical protein